MKRNSHHGAPEERLLDSADEPTGSAHLPAAAETDDIQITAERAGFDTRAGARGGRRTPRPIRRRLDKLVMNRIGHRAYRRLMGCDTLVLTTVGHRSGAERTTPVGGFPGGNGSWLIVAAAGGTATNPAWYYNIAARPDKVRIGIEGRQVAVTAVQLHGAERAQAWQQITTAAPQFAWFQHRTDRELPVIRLTPRSRPTSPRS
ncbi:nitroreductase family deazaflavin-dependent oxidoreductase [Actinocrinis puniceicyclus]|uniref:Nitroreductase family deazaflavin-dependent oxidoreductase n=1 Tax=Actinocrinis puniceicyclus TaxID=977794 RepID=A0A8J7WL34_9ACTN|nr:nitroreductase/quinone reductase family protein [Actinocrinis puniceicyclus]MBS2963288.1 nitroreductase family deazaflavin-dependent oxidoreductase [Actinocrinis puniceicyclus]